MSRQRLGGGDPAFGTGEAEEMVRELRGHLRLEQELREQGQTEAAMRARARATSLVGELARRLERRFERYARAAFDGSPELRDEAVAEMFAELCRRLQDLSGANDLLERRFNYVVQALSIDAIRKVRIHNGRTKTGEAATEGYTLISLDAAVERAESAAEGDRTAQPLNVPDPCGEDGFDQIIERALGEVAVSWLRELPSRQRQVIEARLLAGQPWVQVAARAGVSTKTAQEDFKQALETLRMRYAHTLGGDAK